MRDSTVVERDADWTEVIGIDTNLDRSASAGLTMSDSDFETVKYCVALFDGVVEADNVEV